MSQVAILGANGFIGNRLVEMLHLGGLAEVRPIVRSVARLARPSRFDLDCRIADAFDEEAMSAAFHACDVVVHAVAGDPRTVRRTVAPAYRAAEKAGVGRFVYLSSASVHGQAPPPGTNENSALNGRHLLPYSNAKVEAERTLKRLRRRGRVELVILRPAIVFGPRSHWVSSFVEALLAGQAYWVNGGQGICNSAYIDNVVHAIYRAMTMSAVDREVFLIVDKETITWREFYQPFAEALSCDVGDIQDVPPFASGRTSANGFEKIASFLPDRAKGALSAVHKRLVSRRSLSSPWEVPQARLPRATLEMTLLYQCRYKLPFDTAKRLLGYEPQVSFAEGCRRTISWLAFAGYPVTELRGARGN
jgi:nucleoside-diphosphate-sugar epimerase